MKATSDERIKTEKSYRGNYYIAWILVVDNEVERTWEVHGFFDNEDRAFKSALEALDG